MGELAVPTQWHARLTWHLTVQHMHGSLPCNALAGVAFNNTGCRYAEASEQNVYSQQLLVIQLPGMHAGVCARPQQYHCMQLGHMHVDQNTSTIICPSSH